FEACSTTNEFICSSGIGGCSPGVRAGRRELGFGLSVGGAFIGTANRRKTLRLCSLLSEAAGTPRTRSALTPASAHVCAAGRPGGPTSEGSWPCSRVLF